ncbi:MAG: hypothetical protein KBG15_09620 [Kofleriaceae bacterium]|nr:hypothetical protein [Kofleriaceae bacterium]
MKLLTTVAVLTSLTSVAAAQTTIGATTAPASNAPGTVQIQTPGLAPGPSAPGPASQVAPDVRPMGVTLELTGSSLGLGAEVGADLGYVGLVAGVAGTLFEDNRTYIMARAQSPGKVSVYGGVGMAWVENQHTDSFSLGGYNYGDTVTYTEENEYVMFEGGVKGHWGLVTARAFVGADLELSTNCIASEGDCDHTPFYAGIATGFSFH